MRLRLISFLALLARPIWLRLGGAIVFKERLCSARRTRLVSAPAPAPLVGAPEARSAPNRCRPSQPAGLR